MAKLVSGALLYNYARVAILATAALLRFIEALRRPLEADEGLSLSVASLPIGQELNLLRGDVHPPLFYLVLHAFELVHTPIWTIRLVVAASGVASVALLMLIVRRWSTFEAALAAGTCAAIMPSLIFYDSWVRMYAPFQFLALLAFWLLSLAATQSYGGVKRLLVWASWVASNTAALYTQYLAWMVVVVQIVFAATRRRAFLAQTVAAAVIAGILWLPQFPAFMSQLTHGGLSLGWFQTHLALGLWLLPGQVTVATQLEGWPAELGAAIAWAWILAAFAYSWPQIRTTILPWLAAPAVITVAYSLLAHKLLYADRYYLLFVYALAAWTGVAISRLLRRSPRRAALAMIGAVALASVGCAYAVNPSFYTADWEHVAAVLRARSNPTDLLVFEEGSGHWAFRYYEGRPRHSALLVSSPGQIDDAMRIVDTRRRVWLIGSMIRGLDPNLRLLHHLERCCRLAYFEESTRLLPSEDVEIGLFVRK